MKIRIRRKKRRFRKINLQKRRKSTINIKIIVILILIFCLIFFTIDAKNKSHTNNENENLNSFKKTEVNKIKTVYNTSQMLINQTYAQWLEDLILNAFFFDVQNGFYIDVGANDPNYLSVTKIFYLRGWNGLNIEPTNSSYYRLQAERPRDINVKICAGSHKGNITIYEEGALTTTRKEYSYARFKVHNTSLDTMANICNKNIPKHKEIHFCKIDVEGDEREVLLGFDFENYHPKVFCIECTKPGTMSFTYQTFEDILVKNNYEFVYSYGINRYYVDKNLDYLKERAKHLGDLLKLFRNRKKI